MFVMLWVHLLVYPWFKAHHSSWNEQSSYLGSSTLHRPPPLPSVQMPEGWKELRHGFVRRVRLQQWVQDFPMPSLRSLVAPCYINSERRLWVTWSPSKLFDSFRLSSSCKSSNNGATGRTSANKENSKSTSKSAFVRTHVWVTPATIVPSSSYFEHIIEKRNGVSDRVQYHLVCASR